MNDPSRDLGIRTHLAGAVNRTTSLPAFHAWLISTVSDAEGDDAVDDEWVALLDLENLMVQWSLDHIDDESALAALAARLARSEEADARSDKVAAGAASIPVAHATVLYGTAPETDSPIVITSGAPKPAVTTLGRAFQASQGEPVSIRSSAVARP